MIAPFIPYILGAIAAAAMYIGLQGHWREEGRKEATAEIVQASKKEGAKANEKARKARDAAAVPGAVDRLRKDGACRDC